MLSSRFQIFCLYFLSLLAISHIELSTHSHTLHTPVKSITLGSANVLPSYNKGSLDRENLPKPTLLQLFTRKKIDNFVFNHYNQNRIALTFVDMGYASSLTVAISFDTEKQVPYRFVEKIGFDLHEDMLDGKLNLDINKKNMKLTVSQTRNELTEETTTTFRLYIFRDDLELDANLTHIIRNKQCLTAIRANNVVSHKCYGGYGQGIVRGSHLCMKEGARTRQSDALYPTWNITRTNYEGLRGSGMHWRWVSGGLNGFSKPFYYAQKYIIPTEHGLAINFGHLFGEGEDFAVIDGELIPFEGLKYEFNENLQLIPGEEFNITFKATKPLMEANFTVLSMNHYLEDLGIIKMDYVNAYGRWAGWIENPKNKDRYDFYEIAGAIQTCDSLF